MDVGPFPTLGVEGSAHSSSATAQSIVMSSITFANNKLGDAGAVLTDAGVGCSSTCIQPNSAGVKRIEDWYQLSISSTTNLRIELDYPVSGDNDLDVYLFQLVNGQPRFVASSLNGEGLRELIRRSAGAGTYFIGIQAWETGTAGSDYWLSVRTW